jgi:hypothetical protein
MARRTPPRDRIYNKPFFYLYDKWNDYKKGREEEARQEEARQRRKEAIIKRELELQHKMWEDSRKNIYELQTPEEKRIRREQIEEQIRRKDRERRNILFEKVSPALKEKYAGRRKTKRKGKSRATF